MGPARWKITAMIGVLSCLSRTFASASDSCNKASGNAAVVALQNTTDIETIRQRSIEAAGLDPNKRMQAQYAAGSSPEVSKLISDAAQKMITGYSSGCVAGDVIAIPASWSYVVRELCDFGKTIVNDREVMMCVMR